MFCLFAEDVGLLPDKLFTKLVDRCMSTPEAFKPSCAELFEKMKRGGYYGNERVDQFNGGLFDDAEPLSITHAEMPILLRAAGQQWGSVEPSIFGTLFERILDPDKRAQIGAHYTSKADILLVIEPVVMTPLRRKWTAMQDEIAPQLAQVAAEKDRKKRDLLSGSVRPKLDELRRHLGAQRILDPACGSGNFLYVALQQLLDLDDEIVRFAARYDIALNPYPYIRPTQLHGIEINPYAAELAQVVIWIGHLQWLAEHKIDNPKRPILDKLGTIKNEDAILDRAHSKLPTRRLWGPAEFVVGNPPFLGRSQKRKSLTKQFGDGYVSDLAEGYSGPIQAGSDLCCYWFDQARLWLRTNKTGRVGLLATQGIRGGTNRKVLDEIKKEGDIFFAISDRNWILEGANVHVSIVGFDAGLEAEKTLDGRRVSVISADLKAEDRANALELPENKDIAHQGVIPSGPFDPPTDSALRMLTAGGNPSGDSNADVIIPWANGEDMLESRDVSFVVDFQQMSMDEAAQYHEPYSYVREHVLPARKKSDTEGAADTYWQLWRPRLKFRKLVRERCRGRFLATPRVSKHRVFLWVVDRTLPSDATVAFARDDDYFFGVVQSSIHELWAIDRGTQLREKESGKRYSHSATFRTFPLPWPPGTEDVKHSAYVRIAVAAKKLNEQRERWLNPPEWIEPLAARIDAQNKFEDVPREARALVRQSAIMAAAAKDDRLKNRTLTKLYNERPPWLKFAHEQLDRAVLAAYAATDPAGGWSEDWAAVWTETGAGQPLEDDDALIARRLEVDHNVLANLLRLNHARARGEPPAAAAATDRPAPADQGRRRAVKKA